MYLTAKVQRHLIHMFRLSFTGQRQSHKVATIDLDIPSETVCVILERL